jgi:hypothetical protein
MDYGCVAPKTRSADCSLLIANMVKKRVFARNRGFAGAAGTGS